MKALTPRFVFSGLLYGLMIALVFSLPTAALLPILILAVLVVSVIYITVAVQVNKWLWWRHI